MKRRIAIALAALGLWTLFGVSGAAARGCGFACASASVAQYRGQGDDREDGRRFRRPFLHGPGQRGYGGPYYERRRSYPPEHHGEPLPDRQIWARVLNRVPGRIVTARLHGGAYYFRIINRRGGIVDVVVDRFSGRIVSVRGGP
jgi:hypothetical protein